MRWVIWLSAISILLTTADVVVHIVETTTTGDVLKRLTPEYAGITGLRRTFASQWVWTAASAWVIVSQLGILWIAGRTMAEGKRAAETDAAMTRPRR